MTKIGVFISHSSRDEVVARLLISLVRSAINIPPDDIRCTSVDGYRLPAGASVNETLRTEIFGSTAFVALITPNRIESAFVPFELGARWGAQKPFLPLLTVVLLLNTSRGHFQNSMLLIVTNPDKCINLLTISLRSSVFHQNRLHAIRELSTKLWNSVGKVALI